MKPWASKKHFLGLDFPNLPYFIDGDVRLTESKSIMKYLCRKYQPEMLGRDAVEIATADMVSRVHDDLHAKFGAHCFKDGDTPKLQQDLIEESAKLAAFLGADKLYFTGEQLTYVDFSLFEILDQMMFLSKGKTFIDHENLKNYFNRMEQVSTGFAEFWADDEKCPKKSFKPWFAVLNN